MAIFAEVTENEGIIEIIERHLCDVRYQKALIGPMTNSASMGTG